MIHIAYSLWNYAQGYYIYTGISMTSVMEHTNAEVCFHVLHDETLGEKEKAEMERLCAKWNQQIQFHFVQLDTRLCRRDLYDAGYGDGIFFCINLPDILGAEPRIIYLDSDTIVELDIEKLWRIDLQGKLAAAVWEPPRHGFPAKSVYNRQRFQSFIDRIDWNAYFNSGVMLMNLDKIRKTHNLVEESLQFFESFPMRNPAQDALNWILQAQVKLLDGAYNTFTDILEKPKKNTILHYRKRSAGTVCLDEFDRIVLSYWEKTIWFDASYRDAEKVQLLSGLKDPQVVKTKIMEMGYTDQCEESWREALTKWRNQAPEIPIDLMGRFSVGMCKFKEKQYEQALEILKDCLYYGTDEVNQISLHSLKAMVVCALARKDFELAETYNRMVGVLAPENETYKINCLQIAWERQKQNGQGSGGS